MEQKDIFDKIMDLAGLRIFRPIYIKHKEILRYIFFGVLATIISITSYWIFNHLMYMNELIANIISWILAVLFAFITNRRWVFQVPKKNERNFIKQLIEFYSGRLLTLALEEIIILIFITLLEFPSMVVKIFAQIAVIVTNYIISKLWIFKTD